MYERILVPTDGSSGTHRALEHAVDLAAEYDATVHALYVIDTRSSYHGVFFSPLHDAYREEGEEATQEVVARAEEAGVEAMAAVESGIPHDAILDYAAEHDIDLICMGTHGRTGIGRVLLGSTTEKVVRTADVPVLTVRSHGAMEADVEDVAGPSGDEQA